MSSKQAGGAKTNTNICSGRPHSALYRPSAALLNVTVSVLRLCPPAIKDYEAAGKHNENDRQIKEGMDRAQRLLKQSHKKDYYKILGVKRWAGREESKVLLFIVAKMANSLPADVWACV